MTRENIILLLAPIPIKYLLDEKKVLHSLIAPSIKEGDYSDACKFVARQLQMGVLRFKVFIFISPTVQCHMLTPPE